MGGRINHKLDVSRADVLEREEAWEELGLAGERLARNAAASGRQSRKGAEERNKRMLDTQEVTY